MSCSLNRTLLFRSFDTPFSSCFCGGNAKGGIAIKADLLDEGIGREVDGKLLLQLKYRDYVVAHPMVRYRHSHVFSLPSLNRRSIHRFSMSASPSASLATLPGITLESFQADTKRLQKLLEGVRDKLSPIAKKGERKLIHDFIDWDWSSDPHFQNCEGFQSGVEWKGGALFWRSSGDDLLPIERLVYDICDRAESELPKVAPEERRKEGIEQFDNQGANIIRRIRSEVKRLVACCVDTWDAITKKIEPNLSRSRRERQIQRYLYFPPESSQDPLISPSNITTTASTSNNTLGTSPSVETGGSGFMVSLFGERYTIRNRSAPRTATSDTDDQ